MVGDDEENMKKEGEGNGRKIVLNQTFIFKRALVLGTTIYD